jgi:hypothetical protein
VGRGIKRTADYPIEIQTTKNCSSPQMDADLNKSQMKQLTELSQGYKPSPVLTYEFR